MANDWRARRRMGSLKKRTYLPAQLLRSLTHHDDLGPTRAHPPACGSVRPRVAELGGADEHWRPHRDDHRWSHRVDPDRRRHRRPREAARWPEWSLTDSRGL